MTSTRDTGVSVSGSARTREHAWAIAAAAAAGIAFVAQWWGLPPVALTGIAIVTWFVVAARRWGLVLASGMVVIGWASLMFAVLSFTPLVSADPRIATSAALVIATAGVVPVVRAVSPRRTGTLRTLPVLAMASGGIVWLVGLAVGLVSGGGGGLAWAMYRDSSMNLWLMRLTLEYTGIKSLFSQFDSQPLAPAISTALIPPDVGIAASPETAAAFLTGYASHWATLLVLSAFLAGATVFRLARRPGAARWHRIVVLLGTAAASLFMVSYLPAGVPMYLGQINVSLVFTLVFASIAATVGATPKTSPYVFSALLAATALLLVTWTLFAAVPAALAVVLGWRLWRLRLPRDAVLGPALPGIALLSWCAVIYAWPVARALLTPGNPTADHLTSTTTFANPGYWDSYTNPYSIPLFVALALGTGLAALVVHRNAAWRVRTTVVAAVAVIAGIVPTALALGGLPQPLAYFPAKYLFIATVCLVPGVVGLLLRGIGERPPRRWFATTIAVAVAVVAVVYPVPTTEPALTPTALLVATGRHFGSHDQVVSPFITLADPDTLRLPWRLDPPHDTTIALMRSSIGPDVPSGLLDGVRAPLRNNRGNFSADVACLLGRNVTQPIVLYTADPLLSSELSALCPAEGITVLLVER